MCAVLEVLGELSERSLIEKWRLFATQIVLPMM